jgi:indole-3-glycerol phosphate synthase
MRNYPMLQEIIHAKRDRLAQRKAATPMDAMRALAGMQKRPQPLLSTVTDDKRVILFGQIRYGTPSYDPVSTALSYVNHGVDGLALFTDNLIYDGGINDLALITRAVNTPVLMQNYIFDEYQIVEARAAGAAAVTLIAELIDPSTLRNLISATTRNRMTPIVRVHSVDELSATLEVCPLVIELGRRDPQTGILDLAHIEHLRANIPYSCRTLFYNRLRTFEEAAAIAHLKPDAVLVSPVLLAQENALARLRDVFTT